jgi:peroxiredoxin
MIRLAILCCLIAPTVWSFADPPSEEPPKADDPKGEIPKSEPPKAAVGEKAPDFALTAVGPSSQALTLAQLEGKNVLLEFWATWCGPCIKAQEQFVRLHNVFSDQGLHIVAISDESPDVISRYLKKRPVPYTVATDEKGSIQEAYGVEGMPRCALIDKRGIVRWMGYPSVLRDGSVAEYLRTGTAPKPSASLRATTAPAEPPPAPLLIMKISQARFKDRRFQDAIGLQYAPGSSVLIDGLRCRRQPLSAIFGALLQVSKARLLVDPLDGDVLYDVEFFHMPNHGDPEIKILIDALLREAGLGLQEVEEMRDVWVAAPPSKELTEVEDQRQSNAEGGGSVVQRGETSGDFFKGLENYYGIIIVDETRLAGRYRFPEHQCEPLDEVLQRLEKECGLTLKPDRRKIRLFKLEPAGGMAASTDGLSRKPEKGAAAPAVR